MKEFITKKGVFQSVRDDQKGQARERAKELDALLFNDYYRDKEIISVTYTECLSEEVEKALGTKQAVFFETST
jgi:hypothetical protein